MVHPGKDIAFALRTLIRNPAFTTVVVATLGLGIGANTAIFSVVDGVLLKPLPFRDPDALLMVWEKRASVPHMTVSELDLDDYRARTHVFQDLAGFVAPGSRTVILTGAGDPAEIAPAYITQNYFSLLGIAPLIGRDFLPEEGRRGHNNVAILSYALWQSRFGGSRDVLHRQITLNQQKLQVVGVMGPQVYPAEADVFVPFTWVDPERLPRNFHELNVVGRLRPGQTAAAAQKEMEAISADLGRSYPMTNAGISVNVLPLREEITGNVREPILLLQLAVVLILLIACGNVANLLLVRATGRQKEIAIRVALGAGRGRIIAQFAIECLILSAAGAALGLLLAFCSMPLLRCFGAERIPRLQHVGIDLRVLLFTAAVAVDRTAFRLDSGPQVFVGQSQPDSARGGSDLKIGFRAASQCAGRRRSRARVGGCGGSEPSGTQPEPTPGRSAGVPHESRLDSPHPPAFETLQASRRRELLQSAAAQGGGDSGRHRRFHGHLVAVGAADHPNALRGAGCAVDRTGKVSHHGDGVSGPGVFQDHGDTDFARAHFQA